MKGAKKAVVLMLCVGAVAVAGVFGTMAYFTSQDVVENTFTVGNVAITLDEAKVNEYGVPVDASGAETTVELAPRVDANTYKLFPGHTYTKDPIVHVDDKSENCWLFVKIENDIDKVDISRDKTINDIERKTLATQLSERGWTAVDANAGIYAYTSIVTAGADIPVFVSFTIEGDGIEYDDLIKFDKTDKGADAPAITVTAYAIQADGFTTYEAAWNGAKNQFTGN